MHTNMQAQSDLLTGSQTKAKQQLTYPRFLMNHCVCTGLILPVCHEYQSRRAAARAAPMDLLC